MLIIKWRSAVSILELDNTEILSILASSLYIVLLRLDGTCI